MLEWAPLANEEPFVVCCGLLTKAKVIQDCIQRNALATCIKFYNLESSIANCKDFTDVNTAWADIDILIYTETLPAGCSFMQPQFKQVFGYFHSKLVDYMTAHQMLRQV